MARAEIDAKKVSDATAKALKALEGDKESSEQVRVKKEIMLKRLYDLACAADQSDEKITLSSEEFSLIARNWD